MATEIFSLQTFRRGNEFVYRRMAAKHIGGKVRQNLNVGESSENRNFSVSERTLLVRQ